MGWETRKRGGRYYTRSRKVGGRVVREYVGAGAIGEIGEELDQLQRAERQATAERWRAERAERAAAEELMRAYCRQVDAEVRAALIAAGYHQHDRGDWRRKRGQRGD